MNMLCAYQVGSPVFDWLFYICARGKLIIFTSVLRIRVARG
jgi:hypothetical protein